MNFFGNYKAFLHILITLVILFSGACIKEDFSFRKLDTSLDIEPALATPLGFFSLRLDENFQLNSAAEFSVNSDRIICLNYFKKIVTEPAGEIFRFDPILYEVSIPNPTGGVIDLSSGSYEMNYSARIPLFLSNTGINAEIDSVTLSSGIISIREAQVPGVIMETRIIIPGLKLNGNSFHLELLPENEGINYGLSGYTLELNSEEQRNNLIDIEVYISYPSQNHILPVLEPLIHFNFDLSIREWYKITGYLGQEIINIGQNSIITDLNSLFTGGEFYFADPNLILTTSNSFSVPIGLGLSHLNAESSAGIVLISGTGIPVPPDYFHPAYPQPGNSLLEISDSVKIDSKNTNLAEIISYKPYTINYNLELLMNPGNEKTENTIYSKSRFAADFRLELPFHGSARTIPFQDTLHFDLSRLNFPMDQDIRNVIFRLYYENSFPAEIEIQLYLADENLMIIDTLLETPTKIEAAEPVDRSSENPAFVSGQLETSIPGNELQNVRNGRFMILEGVLNTNESYDIVKIFDNQGLKANLSVIFDIKSNIEDF